MWRPWSGREIDLSLHCGTFTYLYTDTSDRFQIGIHIPALLVHLGEPICFNNSKDLGDQINLQSYFLILEVENIILRL